MRVDGDEVGTFSLLDTVPSTGRALFPSVRAGHVAAAMNEFDTTVDISPYRVAGWRDVGEYMAQIGEIRNFTKDLPGPVLHQIATAWHRLGWATPMTRTQMTAWQEEILTIAVADPEVTA